LEKKIHSEELKYKNLKLDYDNLQNSQLNMKRSLDTVLEKNENLKDANFKLKIEKEEVRNAMLEKVT
jgi:hypothetical protein